MSSRKFDEMVAFVDERQKKLKPAKNVRTVRPRVCGFCKYFHIEEGFSFCERDGGFDKDSGDMSQFSTTCDGWADIN